MPHYLHPRSRSTSSLFAATLLASFVIVGLPHIFPCPAPRRTLADSDMTMTDVDGRQMQRPRRKKRKAVDAPEQLSSTDGASRGLPQATDEEVSTFLQMEEEAETMARVGRECPVPKPGGILGKLLGFSTNTGREPREGRDGAPRTDIPGRGDGS